MMLVVRREAVIQERAIRIKTTGKGTEASFFKLGDTLCFNL